MFCHNTKDPRVVEQSQEQIEVLMPHVSELRGRQWKHQTCRLSSLFLGSNHVSRGLMMIFLKAQGQWNQLFFQHLFLQIEFQMTNYILLSRGFTNLSFTVNHCIITEPASGYNGKSLVLIMSGMQLAKKINRNSVELPSHPLTHSLTLTKTNSVLLLTLDTPLGVFFNQTQSPWNVHKTTQSLWKYFQKQPQE